MRASLLRLFRVVGYSARGFASAEEFLGSDALQSCRCAITDVQMAGISGIKLSEHLSRRESPVPVIIITARTEDRLKQEALASGALCFLTKPIDTDALLQCVERAVNV